MLKPDSKLRDDILLPITGLITRAVDKCARICVLSMDLFFFSLENCFLNLINFDTCMDVMMDPMYILLHGINNELTCTAKSHIIIIIIAKVGTRESTLEHYT